MTAEEGRPDHRRRPHQARNRPEEGVRQGPQHPRARRDARPVLRVRRTGCCPSPASTLRGRGGATRTQGRREQGRRRRSAASSALRPIRRRHRHRRPRHRPSTVARRGRRRRSRLGRHGASTVTLARPDAAQRQTPRHVGRAAPRRAATLPGTVRVVVAARRGPGVLGRARPAAVHRRGHPQGCAGIARARHGPPAERRADRRATRRPSTGSRARTRHGRRGAGPRHRRRLPARARPATCGIVADDVAVLHGRAERSASSRTSAAPSGSSTWSATRGPPRSA